MRANIYRKFKCFKHVTFACTFVKAKFVSPIVLCQYTGLMSQGNPLLISENYGMFNLRSVKFYQNFVMTERPRAWQKFSPRANYVCDMNVEMPLTFFRMKVYPPCVFIQDV
jgi:hypothetical protein